MQRKLDILLARGLLIGTVGVLVVMPFHATLTVWLASFGFDYTVVRLWKEMVLLVLLGGATALLLRSPELRVQLAESVVVRRLSLLIGVYVLLHLLLGTIVFARGDVSVVALGYSLVSNLRFLAFFLVAVVVGVQYRAWLKLYWRRVLLWPAAVVVVFGLLQDYVLPYDVLRHVGYSLDTIPPYITVDEKIEYVRVQSTMRGPNPLGAYLVPILAAFVALFVTRRRRYVRVAFGMVATLLVLYATYSRSAWIGAAVAVGLVLWGVAASARARKFLLVVMAAVAVVGLFGVWALQDNRTAQNLVLHTDDTSTAASSNDVRADALSAAATDVLEKPLGRGPGTAGPASVYNDAPARISENYFLQIGQEVGVLGMVLLIAIHVVIGAALWRAGGAKRVLPLILAASLAGVVLINMLSHAWADDTLAYVWWGFAGLAVGWCVVKGRERS